ncbi:hypothetical protein [Alteromonas stellipolaris]|uniref:hypothetical protein n=1 Tax=Alteromonas stellipolaris TaxID=233316 RepID=UPI001DB64C9F|nr:hypothetical protein [Alteromonas stellipolaris]MBZ2163339.1 hypothetical protein [Alteromonas stellipolaris]
MKNLLLLLFLVTTFQTSNANEQLLARVFEKNIYQSDLKNEGGRDLSLQQVIIPKLLEGYKAKKNISFEPTNEEMEHFKIWFNKRNPNHKQESKEREKESLARIRELAKSKQLTDENTQRLVSEFLEYSKNTASMDEQMANFVLPYRKSQIYFYNNYGGGRLLWQQRGTEAFDAFHNWLKSQEKKGNFMILAEEDRKEFYQYWNKESGFLSDDKETITQFLKPEWSR